MINEDNISDEVVIDLTQVGDPTHDPDSLIEQISHIRERYTKGEQINEGGVKLILKATDSLTNRPIAKAVLIDSKNPRRTDFNGQRRSG